MPPRSPCGRGPLAEDDEAPRRRQHRHDPARREVGQPGEEGDEEEEDGLEHEPREGAPACEGRRDGGDPVRRSLRAGMARPVALVLGGAMRPQGFSSPRSSAATLSSSRTRSPKAAKASSTRAGSYPPPRAAARRPAAGRSSFQYARTSGQTYRTPPDDGAAANTPSGVERGIRDPPLRIPDRAATQSTVSSSRRVPARPFRGPRGGAPRATAAVPPRRAAAPPRRRTRHGRPRSPVPRRAARVAPRRDPAALPPGLRRAAQPPPEPRQAERARRSRQVPVSRRRC